jgi:membrane protein
MAFSDYSTLLKNTLAKWWDDKAPPLGASLAYYTVFSLSPLLVIVIAVAGLAFGQEAAQGQIVAQIRSLVGQEGAKTIQAMIESGRKTTSGSDRTYDFVDRRKWRIWRASRRSQ